MKICILTLPLHTNYGGLLQAYALQTVLKSMGHEPVTDRNGAPPLIPRHKRPLYFGIHFIKRYIYRDRRYNPYKFLFRFGDRMIMRRCAVHTERFIERNIDTVNFFSRDNNPNPEILSSLDGLVVGSDQVWRPAYSYCPAYFLNFAANYPIRRIAYAASFGLDNLREYDPDTLTICAKAAKSFDAVSVREDSAVTLCKEHFNIDALHLLDPTMLLEKEEYLRLIEEEDKAERKDVLTYYLLDKSEEKMAIVERIAKELKLSRLDIMPQSLAAADHVFPSVSSWLAGFRDADFVITDSFHGTIFSIIFNKPFITIDNSKRGSTRLSSLLKVFGLTDRLISPSVKTDRLPREKIDYDRVNGIKKEWQEKSRQFLESNLK